MKTVKAELSSALIRRLQIRVIFRQLGATLT